MHPAKAVARSCEEKARLLKRCALAESDYNRAIQLMVWRIGTERLKEHNPEVLHDFGEAARKIVEDARAALHLHLTEHGCY